MAVAQNLLRHPEQSEGSRRCMHEIPHYVRNDGEQLLRYCYLCPIALDPCGLRTPNRLGAFHLSQKPRFSPQRVAHARLGNRDYLFETCPNHLLNGGNYSTITAIGVAVPRGAVRR
jgi:hypothetical protein